MDWERDIPAFALECCMAFRNLDGILSWLFLSEVLVEVMVDVELVGDDADNDDGVAVAVMEDEDVGDKGDVVFSTFSLPHDRSRLLP